MSFSLKALLGSVALVAVLLVASKKLHEQYYIAKLNRFLESGDVCSVSDLLQYGQDQGFRANWADKVLVRVAKGGDYLTLRLFRRTTDFDRKLDGERTPLMLAAENGHFNAVKFLLVQEVDTGVRDSSGATAFDIAMKAHHPEIAALISESEGESWHHLLQIEGEIFALMSDGACSRDTVEELLRSEKYASLAALRADVPNVGDETGWYRVNDRVSIGALTSNVEFIWVIDDMRVGGVDYFYPLSFFE